MSVLRLRPPGGRSHHFCSPGGAGLPQAYWADWVLLGAECWCYMIGNSGHEMWVNVIGALDGGGGSCQAI